MPFDNEGIFKRVHDWQQDKANNIDINAQRLDEEDNNFANGLSQTLLRDGTVPLTGNLNANNHKITGLVNGTNNTDAITVAQLNTKQNIITGAASTVVASNLTVNKVLISDNNGKIKASNKSLDEIIDESNLVHKTGDETISGKKTFTTDPVVYNNNPVIYHRQPNFNKGNIPQTEIYANGGFVDDSGTVGSIHQLGTYGCAVNTTGETRAYLRAYRNVEGSTDGANLEICYPIDGNPYTYAPTPTDTTSTSSKQIATVGWVNSANNNVVHRNNNETITGLKTFTQHIRIPLSFDASDHYVIYVPDTNEKGICSYQVYYAGNDIYNRMLAHNSTVDKNAFLDIRVNDNGNAIFNINGTATLLNVTQVSSDINSKNLATMGWVNNPVTSTNVVHRTGTETIGGNKTYTDDIYIKKTTPVMAFRNSNITKGSIPNSNQYWNIAMEDSTGGTQNKRLGVFETRVDTSGNTATYMLAYKNKSNSTDCATLSLVYPVTGDPYATCPTPTDTTSTSSTQIATVGWVNSANNNVVHKTGKETINNEKTFTANLIRAHTDITKGTNPSSPLYWGVEFTDKNGPTTENRLGLLETKLNTNGDVETYIASYLNTNGSRTQTALKIVYTKSGDAYAIAPASDVNNSIVTTVNKSKGTNGYFQLGNGLIVQWGRILVKNVTNKNSITTITFPKAFTTTNYSFAGTFENNTSTSPSRTDDVTFCTTEISKTAVKGFGFDAGGNHYDAYMRWLAIGY